MGRGIIRQSRLVCESRRRSEGLRDIAGFSGLLPCLWGEIYVEM